MVSRSWRSTKHQGKSNNIMQKIASRTDNQRTCIRGMQLVIVVAQYHYSPYVYECHKFILIIQKSLDKYFTMEYGIIFIFVDAR